MEIHGVLMGFQFDFRGILTLVNEETTLQQTLTLLEIPLKSLFNQYFDPIDIPRISLKSHWTENPIKIPLAFRFLGTFPYIGLKNRPNIYGRYLQSRNLKWPHPMALKAPRTTLGSVSAGCPGKRCSGVLTCYARRYARKSGISQGKDGDSMEVLPSGKLLHNYGKIHHFLLVIQL